MHELAGLPTRPTRSRELRKILRVAYRRGAPLGQVTGIDWAVADGIVAACMARPDDLRSIRDAALIAIMSDALLRIGEACALRVDDIGRCDGGTGLVVVRVLQDRPSWCRCGAAPPGVHRGSSGRLV